MNAWSYHRSHQVQLAAFCRRWHVRELAVFGSALREDFGPQSDLDILVTFEPDVEWSLLDHARMEQELEALLGRPIDLLSKRAVERSHNWILRREILDTAEVVYASR
jgi:predicted nucleotidyltransferase